MKAKANMANVPRITGKPFRVRVLPERVEFVSSSVIVIIPLLIVNITL